MRTYQELIEQLEENLRTLEEQKHNILIQTEKAVTLCKETLQKIQERVAVKKFSTKEDEILFFKHLKPAVLSKLIYYIEFFNIQSKRPKGLKKFQVKYLNGHIQKRQRYFNDNMEFYHYYLKKETNMDHQYFLRENKKVRLNIESYHFFTSSNFSTSHDNTVATIMAYEELIKKLAQEISKLTTNNTMHTTYKFVNQEFNLNWTGSKIDLIELIYALHNSGAVNNGNVDIKELAMTFQEIFNIDLGNYYHGFVELRSRKINPTKFMDKLKTSLLDYIKGLDALN